VRLVEYLFHRPGAVGPFFDFWGAALFGAFCALILALLVLGYLMRVFSEGHILHEQITRQVVRYGVAVQVAGLVVLGLRVINFPGLSMRLFLFLPLIAEVVALGYLVWWMRTKYPDEIAYFEWEEQKRDYLPRPVRGKRGRTRTRAG
jgi:type III secretory pathway component EscV